MDKSTFERLSQINDDLVEHLKFLLEKKDLDALAKLIPIVDRLTHLLIEIGKETPQVWTLELFSAAAIWRSGKATWRVNIGLIGSTALQIKVPKT